MKYVQVREVGKAHWLYLDGKGGETRLLVRAAHYPDETAETVARNIEADNPGVWEARTSAL